jgi:hypothetical protein
LYARGPAQHAIAAMILALRTLPIADRDHALQTVLLAAIAATAEQPVAVPALAPRPPAARRRRPGREVAAAPGVTDR